MERQITQNFLTRLIGKSELECCATQDAINELAEEFSGDRPYFFNVMETTSDEILCDLIMVAWAKAPLTLATGLSRDQWLVFFDDNLKPRP